MNATVKRGVKIARNILKLLEDPNARIEGIEDYKKACHTVINFGRYPDDPKACYDRVKTIKALELIQTLPSAIKSVV